MDRPCRRTRPIQIDPNIVSAQRTSQQLLALARRWVPVGTSAALLTLVRFMQTRSRSNPQAEKAFCDMLHEVSPQPPYADRRSVESALVSCATSLCADATAAHARAHGVQDVKALNAYFCDREEEVIMWLQQLDEQLSTAETTRDKQLCHIGYIHLHGAPHCCRAACCCDGLVSLLQQTALQTYALRPHGHTLTPCGARAGQLVLLFHWSMLNYAALVKILKKHGAHTAPAPATASRRHPRRPPTQTQRADKRSGMELKAPVLSNALRQPFSTTNVLSSLMAKCEAKARELNQVTGGLDQLIEACPQYQGLFLVKCVPQPSARMRGGAVPAAVLPACSSTRGVTGGARAGRRRRHWTCGQTCARAHRPPPRFLSRVSFVRFLAASASGPAQRAAAQTRSQHSRQTLRDKPAARATWHTVLQPRRAARQRVRVTQHRPPASTGRGRVPMR